MRKALKENFSRKFGEHWESLRNELVEDGLITRSGNTYQFPHLSFQEFLTAKGYVGDPQPRRVRRALDSFLNGNNWWREVLRFYTGLSAKPREITLWLLTEIDRNINKVSVTSSRIDDLLAGVAEAFPEFPIEDYVDRLPKPAKHV